MAEHAPRHKQDLVVIDGALALIAILLIVQIWLLSATLEAYLGGGSRAVLPAALVSVVIFLACLGLSLFVGRVDQQSRR
jgi:F0F1-type ATP synthase assembly protein I